jgi:TetR/AcrR family transcriptional regulator, transcriptional repressor for nem operon
MPRISKEREAAVRARILDAGIRVFEEQGFAGASMSAIAAAAGMSNGGLYVHFGSKEELYLAAFAAVVADEEQRLLGSIQDAGSITERVRLAIDYFVDVAVAGRSADFRSAGPGFLLHAWATADESPAIRETLLHRRAQMGMLTRQIVADGIARGEAPPDIDVDGLAGALPSLLDGLLLQRAERGADFTADEARRQVYAVIDGILGRR